MGDGSRAVLSFRAFERTGYARQAQRAWHQRSGVILRLETEEGLRLEAEASPLPGHSIETLEAVMAWLRGWGQGWPAPRSGLASLDFALSDLQLQLADAGVSKDERPVHVNGLLDDLLAEVDLTRLLAQGVDTVKVKVGRRGAAESERLGLEALRQDGLRLRADGNQCMGPDFRPDAWTSLELDLFEEPAPWQVARAWAEQLPLGWDESVRSHEPEALSLVPRPDAIVLKPTLLGAFERVAGWAEAARRAGARVLLTHAYESEVGMRSLLRWARRLGAPGERHGLMPHRFCASDKLYVRGGVLREDQ